MNNQDIQIDLGMIQETLMMPLWERAREIEKDNPIVYDNYAKNITVFFLSQEYRVLRWDRDRRVVNADGPVSKHLS